MAPTLESSEEWGDGLCWLHIKRFKKAKLCDLHELPHGKLRKAKVGVGLKQGDPLQGSQPYELKDTGVGGFRKCKNVLVTGY